MLDHKMQEGQLRKVKLKEFSKSQLQFFFRLAYTGQVDPEEWPEEPEPKPSPFSLASLHRTSLHPTLSPGLLAKGGGKGKTKTNTGKIARATVSSDDDEEFVPAPKTVKTKLPPLQLLLAAAKFSKQYDVQAFFRKTIDKIEDRLSENADHCFGAFQDACKVSRS